MVFPILGFPHKSLCTTIYSCLCGVFECDSYFNIVYLLWSIFRIRVSLQQYTNFGSSTKNSFHEGPQESILVGDRSCKTSFALSPYKKAKIQHEKECFLFRDRRERLNKPIMSGTLDMMVSCPTQNKKPLTTCKPLKQLIPFHMVLTNGVMPSSCTASSCHDFLRCTLERSTQISPSN